MTAIEFENISKQYRLGLVSTRTLSHDLNRWWQTAILHREDPYLKIGETNDRATKGDSEYVWALRDINFKVEQGDVVGIIGKNGAGKSTLLKLLSRVTTPTTGVIRARGRIASLLEVGTGFHSELTGRENIYMNGTIMGMSKAEVTRKLDEIVDFSGCERYLDTPVKRYSSGMTVRLGFAVAAHLDPEILVVDEVLAVGDAEFQKKAIGKMQDVSRGEGRTVLFVSHNMDSIRNLCKSGVVLSNGMVDFTGTASDAINYYLQTNHRQICSHIEIDDIHFRHNQKELIRRKMEFVSIDMLNNPEDIAADEPLEFDIKIKKNKHSVRDFQCALIIKDITEKRFATYVTDVIQTDDKDEFTVRLTLKDHQLAKGNYILQFDLGIKDYANVVDNFDGVNNAFTINITLMHRNPMTAFAAWDSNYGYYLNSKNLIGTLLK